MTITQSMPSTSYYRDAAASGNARQATTSAALPTGAAEALLSAEAEGASATTATAAPAAAMPEGAAVPDLRRMQLFGSGGFLTPTASASDTSAGTPAMSMSMAQRVKALDAMRALEATTEPSSNPLTQSLVAAMTPDIDGSGSTGTAIDVTA